MTATPRLHDTSPTPSPERPVRPGDTAFQATPAWSHGPDCLVAMAPLAVFFNSGVHADAPARCDPTAQAALDDDFRPTGPILPGHAAPALDGTVRRRRIQTFADPSKLAGIDASQVRAVLCELAP